MKIPQAIIIIGMLCLLTSGAFAWALNQPTPPSNRLIVAKGTSTKFCESIQNMVGEQTPAIIKLEKRKNPEMFSFKKTNSDDQLTNNTLMVTVPYGENEKPWCVDIHVPSTAKTGQQYELSVKASRKQESLPGQISFSTGQIAKLFVTVKDQGNPETFEPPANDGTISNNTQPVDNTQLEQKARENNQKTINSTMTTETGNHNIKYLVLVVLIGVIVIMTVVILYKKEVIQ